MSHPAFAIVLCLIAGALGELVGMPHGELELAAVRDVKHTAKMLRKEPASSDATPLRLEAQSLNAESDSRSMEAKAVNVHSSEVKLEDMTREGREAAIATSWTSEHSADMTPEKLATLSAAERQAVTATDAYGRLEGADCLVRNGAHVNHGRGSCVVSGFHDINLQAGGQFTRYHFDLGLSVHGIGEPKDFEGSGGDPRSNVPRFAGLQLCQNDKYTASLSEHFNIFDEFLNSQSVDDDTFAIFQGALGMACDKTEQRHDVWHNTSTWDLVTSWDKNTYRVISWTVNGVNLEQNAGVEIACPSQAGFHSHFLRLWTNSPSVAVSMKNLLVCKGSVERVINTRIYGEGQCGV